MATGKTNARHIRVLVDDSGGTARQLSSVSNVTGVGLTHNEQDVTAYSDGVVNVTLGHPRSEIEISGPIDNTATTGPHIVFSGIVGLENSAGTLYTSTVTVQVGIRAAPTTGNPEFEGEFVCSSYVINPNDATYTARMVPATATAPAWGTVS